MKINKILIVLGEPQSTFSEILFKYFSSKKFPKNKKKIILIGNIRLLKKQMKKLNYNLILNPIENIRDAIKQKLNILNINYKSKKAFSKISPNSKKYISNCFKLALDLIKKMIKLH